MYNATLGSPAVRYRALHHSGQCQVSFNALGGYQLVVSMLVRVEDNLPLLAPCSELSMAVAAGQQPSNAQQSAQQSVSAHQQMQPRRSLNSITSSVSSGSGPPPQPPSASGTPNRTGAFTFTAETGYRRPAAGPQEGHSEPMGLYGTFVKGEFDSYYSTLVMVLLNIVLDDLGVQQLCPGTNLPMLPPKGCEIRNFKAVSLLVALLGQPTVGLNTVALRVCFALMRVHAPNVAALEVLGVVSTLVEKLLAIVYVGSLDCALLTAAFAHQAGKNRPDLGDGAADSSPKTEDYSGPTTDSSGDLRPPTMYPVEVLGALAHEVVLLLQIVAVSTANRDSSVLALLALVSQHAAQSRCCSGAQGGDVRCQNCETEMACLQCLNDR
jgi:hypothetical protein